MIADGAIDISTVDSTVNTCTVCSGAVDIGDSCQVSVRECSLVEGFFSSIKSPSNISPGAVKDEIRSPEEIGIEGKNHFLSLRTSSNC